MNYNNKDYYVGRHHDDTEPFVTKLEFSKGNWWTVKNLKFKAKTIDLINITEEFNKLKQTK